MQTQLKQTLKYKWKSLLEYLGVETVFLKNKHGPCPFCGGNDRYRYDDKNGDGTFFCNSCGSGDGFEFLQRYLNCGFRDAVKKIEAVIGKTELTIQKANYQKMPTRRINETLKKCVQINGKDHVSVYLKNRGLTKLSNSILMAKKIEYYENGEVKGFYDAMVCKIFSPRGRLEGLQITYLKDEKKANVLSPRKTIGQISPGAAIRLSEHNNVLGIAEGVETSLAAAELSGIPVWAVISANNMESFIAPPNVNTLTVFGDNDEKYGGQKAAYTCAHKQSVNKVTCKVYIPKKEGTDWLDYLITKTKQKAA